MRQEMRWLCTALVLGVLGCSQEATPTATRDAALGQGDGPRYVVQPLGSLGGTVSQGLIHRDRGLRARPMPAYAWTVILWGIWPSLRPSCRLACSW